MFRLQRTQAKNRLTRFLASFAGILLTTLVLASAAHASGSKFVVVDDGDSSFSTTGFSLECWANSGSTNLNAPPEGSCAHFATVASGGTASAVWNMGNITVGAGGNYVVEAFIPDDNPFTTTSVTYTVQRGDIFCGNLVNIASFTAVDQGAAEGTWKTLGTIDLEQSACYKVVLTNDSTTGGIVWADAVRFQREFESKATIPDMPTSSSAVAAGTTYVLSSTNGSPTVIDTLTFTCPKTGFVVVSGSGESAAVSTAGSAFIGLAYSISKDSTATDNSNVVQSSALATFAGDANRDFLFVQRTDSCAAGTSVTYRLTGYATSAQTKISGGAGSSFMWNGRLTAQYTP